MIKRALRGQRGMSLVELVAAIAITGLLTTAFGSLGFSLLIHGDANNAHVTAASDTEEAARQIAQDGQSAQSTDLVAGADPVGSLTLSWMDPANGNTHQIAYALSGEDLRRTETINSVVQSVRTEASHVLGVEFSKSASQTRVFKMALTSSGGSSRVSETREYYVTLRAMD